jgi:hypothetical protein
MRSNGPVATKELAMTGREWPGGQLASDRYKEDLYISEELRPKVGDGMKG